jgi:hypothetical protein
MQCRGQRPGGGPARRDAGTIVEAVVTILSADGSREAIAAGVRKLRANFPNAEVEVESNEGQPQRQRGLAALDQRGFLWA